MYPDELRYTEKHVWVRLEAKEATCGLSMYAESEMGDIVFLDLPEEGTALEKGDVFGSVESAKAVEDLFAPISGEVVRVNTDLVDAPEAINEDPYGEGWMVVLKIEDESELDDLMSAEAYEELLSDLQES